MRTGSIYFIQAEPDGLVKIGWTTRPPERRIKEIQLYSPVNLVLRATIPRVFKALELELHHQFADNLSHGGWFEPHPDMPNVMVNDQRTGLGRQADDPSESLLDAMLRKLEPEARFGQVGAS
jgi:hypothetical protein